MKTAEYSIRPESAITSLAVPFTAQAQQANEPQNGIGLADIIVTAQRRSERLQDVPMTVNAVTSEDLQDYKLQRFEDVAALSPGLSISRNARSVRSSVRGPQRLLRGRLAPLGAITLTTRRPNYWEYDGTAEATYTDFSSVNIQGGFGGNDAGKAAMKKWRQGRPRPCRQA